MLAAEQTRDGLIGSSRSMLELNAYLSKVAQSDATVLVTGETGTGKERVASCLHHLGPRSDGPFVSVNCAAIPETLLESELFGHRRGAFTSASNDFLGRFAEADHGTLFLDEVGELALSAQAKLLRAIEERDIVALGSTRHRRVDVRIVVATNAELEDMVSRHAFRADLYYRLNVVRIEVPPLRERPDDIGPILDHFIAQQNQRLAMQVRGPDSALLDCMRRYDWPGNIRELRNLVEAVFVDPPQGRSICLGDLPPNFRRMFLESEKVGQSERERLVEVLRETKWNKVAAARQMNWSRMTLYRKLAKYDLDKAE